MTEPAWLLRSWRHEDGPEVSSLLDLVYATDPTARAIHDVHGPPSSDPDASSRAQVATVADVLVGVGTIWESAFAPARWRLSLQVHPDYRRRGIGSTLLDTLSRLLPDDGRPIQTGLSANAFAGISLCRHHGFRHLMRTRLGIIDPAHIPPETWLDFDAAWFRAAAAGYRVTALPDLMSRSGIITQLAALHEKMYRQSHAWSQPARLTPSQAEATFLGLDLIPDALFIAQRDRVPVGVSSLRHGSTPGDVDLGWTGVFVGHAAAAPHLTATLLHRCLSHARRHGWTVHVEVDAADQILWNLTHALPVTWQPDWLNLERTSDPRRRPLSRRGFVL